MFKKRFVRIFLTIVIIGIALAGYIKVNIINTKAISPLGNTKENYDLVSEEFGEDFSSFTQDKSPIKIYVEKDKDTIMRVGDTDLIIKSESALTNFINEMFQGVKNLF